jgi:hypothetical protein
MVSDILPDIVYDISQAGFLPLLDKEAAGFQEYKDPRSIDDDGLHPR